MTSRMKRLARMEDDGDISHHTTWHWHNINNYSQLDRQIVSLPLHFQEVNFVTESRSQARQLVGANFSILNDMTWYVTNDQFVH